MSNFEYKVHISLPMKNKKETKEFYTKLGFNVLDFSPSELMVNFFEQHIAFHELGPSVILKSPSIIAKTPKNDDIAIPSAHFGAFITAKDYHEMLNKLEKMDVKIIFGPNVYSQKDGIEEYMTFFEDCNGIPLEIKASSNDKYPIDKISEWSHTNTHSYNK
ncbi:hypothetical protein B4919_03165 [Francisella tularensis subsp. novicida]|uniref:VOC family protein n=1 Tax=Francisella tularensis TaxID=263 RepID=UPI000CE2A134|nr:VOC family protein [Francisella tularensis]AVC43849.1 hypothetical protein B4919_03165 [Francisella tularensis subsp. novicida]